MPEIDWNGPRRPEPEPVAPANGRAWLALLALGSVLLSVQVWRAKGSLHRDAAPAEIGGTWVSDDPRYAGRAFTVADSFVDLYVGGGDLNVHKIHTVEVVPGPPPEVRWSRGPESRAPGPP